MTPRGEVPDPRALSRGRPPGGRLQRPGGAVNFLTRTFRSRSTLMR